MTASKCQSTSLVPFRGKKLFRTNPQNRILVPLWGSLQNSDDHPRHFYMDPPPPLPLYRAFKDRYGQKKLKLLLEDKIPISIRKIYIFSIIVYSLGY